MMASMGDQRTFHHLLVNTLVSGVTSSFLWFALTFWAYLETGSVMATAVIGAAFSLSSAVFAPWFGTYVDHHRKHEAMALATTVSVVCFAVATAVFVAVDVESASPAPGSGCSSASRSSARWPARSGAS